MLWWGYLGEGVQNLASLRMGGLCARPGRLILRLHRVCIRHLLVRPLLSLSHTSSQTLHHRSVCKEVIMGRRQSDVRRLSVGTASRGTCLQERGARAALEEGEVLQGGLVQGLLLLACLSLHLSLHTHRIK